MIVELCVVRQLQWRGSGGSWSRQRQRRPLDAAAAAVGRRWAGGGWQAACPGQRRVCRNTTQPITKITWPLCLAWARRHMHLGGLLLCPPTKSTSHHAPPRHPAHNPGSHGQSLALYDRGGGGRWPRGFGSYTGYISTGPQSKCSCLRQLHETKNRSTIKWPISGTRYPNPPTPRQTKYF